MINILAVESNKRTASQIYAALSDKSRYHLAVVESGYTALEAIGQKHFDIVIISRDMPYINGFKLAQKIRSTMGDKTTPFIITAPEFTREEVESFIYTGVFDFWESPLSMQRIKLTVDVIAKGWKSKNDNLLSYEEYLERKR